MAHTQPFAGSTVVVLDQVSWALQKALTSLAGPQHFAELWLAEKHIPEAVLRIAGDPTVTQSGGSSGVHGQKLIGAIRLPNARQLSLATAKLVHQFRERTQLHALFLTFLKPYVEQVDQECRKRLTVKRSLSLIRPPWKRHVHLKVGNSGRFGKEVKKVFRTGFQRLGLENCDHSDRDIGRLGGALLAGEDVVRIVLPRCDAPAVVDQTRIADQTREARAA